MPSFSSRSISILDTVDPALKDICYSVVKHYDIVVLSGFRGEEEQNRLVEEGKSKLVFPKSKHNQDRNGLPQLPCCAVDVVPYPIDWGDSKRFIFMAGMMFHAAHSIGVKLRWGGNWDGDDVIIDDQTFNDLPHFELIG